MDGFSFKGTKIWTENVCGNSHMMVCHGTVFEVADGRRGHLLVPWVHNDVLHCPGPLGSLDIAASVIVGSVLNSGDKRPHVGDISGL